MSEDVAAKFREPKTVYEECAIFEEAISSSTKSRNLKWAVTIRDSANTGIRRNA